MQSITLQTSDTVITSGDILGRLNYAASAEADGSAAILIAGSIYVQAEGSFQSSSNPAAIVFATAAADSSSAVGRIKVTDNGHLVPIANNSYDLGSSDLNFRNLYVQNIESETLTVDTNTLYIDAANNRVGIGTTSPAYQVEIENTGANALLVLDRTDGAACFIEGQATRSAFGSVGTTPLALAYNSAAVVLIGANGAITVNPDGDGFTFPTTDGSANQVLQTDGNGSLSFATVSTGSTYTAGSGLILDGTEFNVYGGSGNFQYLEVNTSNNVIPKIEFTGSGVTDTPINLEVASSFESATGSGSALLFQGTQGQLFSITDNLSSGTIFSVSDITGLPMLEIDASGHVQIGEFADDITLHQAVLLSGGVPASTTNKLYNNAGDLYWDGNPLVELPTGGLESQILYKVSDASNELAWIDNYATELRELVKNDTGSDILKGTAVMATGAVGDRIQVAPATADGSIEARYMLGVASEDITNSTEGYVTLVGPIKGLNTGSYTVGTVLWLDPNNDGELTSTQPSSPNLQMSVAIVTSSNASNGRIFVRMWEQQPGLHELHDVNVDVGLASGDLIAYNSSNSTWENITNPSGYFESRVDTNETNIALKANIASPTFTGTPAAPTASAGTNTTQIATTAFVSTAVANLVDSAPATLDTLNELAAALGDDANFSTTVTNSLATKLANVVEDTTPQLGGTLDANGNTIDMGTYVITDAKVGQWDTAYGWGDHGSAGYLTAHPTISAASSSDNSGRTYIQDVILDSNGHVTGLATATETVTDTTYSAGTGMTLSSTTFNVNVNATTQTVAANTVSATSSRTYAVQVNASDELVVNVPWTDTDTNTQLSQEEVEDFAGNLIATGGTKTGITVTYQDSTNDVDFVVGGLTTTEIAASTLVTETEGISSNDNDTTIPTSAAVKDYVDNNAGGGGGTVQGTDGTYDIQPTSEGATAGNTRGEGSVDLQTHRSAATQVASGGCSVIGGGANNTASGSYGFSTVSGGYGNTASASYSTVGGGSSNTACGSSTVGGGASNNASGSISTVSGGYSNTASGFVSTVSGGYYNTASNNYSTVSGGYSNTASASRSTVGGGSSNTASGCLSTVNGGYGNTASGWSSTVAGGNSNTASAYFSSVTGGRCNITNARHSIIAGGHRNIIQSPTNECCSRGVTIGGGVGHNSSGGTLSTTTGDLTGTITCCDAGVYSTIAGGMRNIATGACSTVGGGACNTASNLQSTVGGGGSNTASALRSTVSGGTLNTASGSCSTIGGGGYNTASGGNSTIGGGVLNTASGPLSTIAGGINNTASGYCSTAGGGRSNTASGDNSTVAGGCCNITNARHSIVAGGHRNIIQSPTNECCSRGATISGGVGHNSSGGTLDATTGDLTGTITCCDAGVYSTIAGGLRNCATGACSSIGGGTSNTASGGTSTVSGGCGNTASGGASAVGGGYNNTASGYYSTVGGGGGSLSSLGNTASGIQSTVSGGYNNTASGQSSAVGGGGNNTASSYYSTIGGGRGNIASGYASTVSGGYYNTASAFYSSVAGGYCNTTNARYSIIAGGNRNIIQSPTNECCSRGATIGGGVGHNSSGGTLNATTGDLTGTITCCNAGAFSTIAGGLRNIATGACSSIGGGCGNTASSGGSTVSGGRGNTASGSYSTVGGRGNVASGGCSVIGGGLNNTASALASTVSGGYLGSATGATSTVGGGWGNTASGVLSTASGGKNNTASGPNSTVSGGYCNTASAIYSTIGGGCCNTASASNSTVGGGRSNTASAINSSVAGGCCNITNARHSIVAGGHRNIIQSPTNECCSRGATISGGVGHNSSGGTLNATTGDLTGTITCCNAGVFSTIAGGVRNIGTGACSSIGGGSSNTASGAMSTVSGGLSNTASSSQSTIGGGRNNAASSTNTVVAGGSYNTASGYQSTVSGGYDNTASNSMSVVGGGCGNTASGLCSIIAAGKANTSSSTYSVVSGGAFNASSGNASVVGGGYSNTSSGSRSTVAGGEDSGATGGCSAIGGGMQNCATGTVSSIVGGQRAKATKYGEVAHAAGRFAAVGDAQHTVLVARDSTTDATANQVLFLDGSSQRLTIPAETTWMFTVKLAAHNDTDNDGGWWFFRGGIRRDASNNTSLIGTVFEEYSKDSNISSATASVVADDTNEALEIRVTGVASKNIRWVAVVDISQVSWGTP